MVFGCYYSIVIVIRCYLMVFWLPHWFFCFVALGSSVRIILCQCVKCTKCVNNNNNKKKCNVRGSGRRMEGKQKEWKGRHDYRYGMEGVMVRGRGNESQRPCGAWWLIGRVDAYHPKSRGFESRSSHHIGQVFHSQLPVALRRETSTQYPCCIGSASE